MDVKLFPSYLYGQIDAMPSKSDAHRLLICAALADRPTKIIMSDISDDISATVRCLRSLGAGIEFTGHLFCTVLPIPAGHTDAAVLDCGESGSTLRFLLPVSAALQKHAVFSGQGRIKSRPLSELVNVLSSHGCVFSEPFLPFHISGKLSGGKFALPGDVSSQYISGLLFALPLLQEDSEIILTTPLESSGYVEMTLSSLLRFGIHITKTTNGFLINGRQRYSSPGEIKVEGDWSNSAFFLSAGAIGKKIECFGLSSHSVQGDKAIRSLLSRFGAKVEYGENSVFVSPGKLISQVIDVSEIPDLLPVLSVVAALSCGETVLKNASRLRLKESDRLYSVHKSLKALGADIKEQSDALVIAGKPSLSGGETESFNDHRIAMAVTIASIRCENPVLLHDAQAVNKSYPGFFADFNKLGGNAHVL